MNHMLFSPKKTFQFFTFPLSILWVLVYLNGLFFLSGLGGNDGWGYYANLESLLIDRDWKVIDNVYAYNEKGNPLGVSVLDPRAQDLGGGVTYYPWGHALYYSVPFLLGGWVADHFSYSLDTSHFPESSPYHGQSRKLMTRVVALSLWSELLTLFLVTVLFFTAQSLGASRWQSFFITLASWWGSPLPFYANNAMSHVVSCLFIALLCWSFIKKDYSPVLSGLFAGLAALARSNNALIVFVAILGAYQRQGLKGLVKAGLSFSCVFTFNMTNWYLLTGDPLDPGYDFSAGVPAETFPFFNVTFDLRGGYFIWFPAALFAFYFLVKRVKREKLFFPWLLLMLIYFSVIALRFEYHGAGGYGPRYLCPLAIGLLPGFLDLLQRAWGKIVVGASLFWSTFLYLLHSSKIYTVDPLTGEGGRHISNYFEGLLQIPVHQWCSRLLEGSMTWPFFLSHPWLLPALFLPVLIFLHVGFWWSRVK